MMHGKVSKTLKVELLRWARSQGIVGQLGVEVFRTFQHAKQNQLPENYYHISAEMFRNERLS